MKKLILFLAILSTFLISCETGGGTKLTDIEKTTIITELKPIVQQIKDNSASCNFEKLIQPYLDSPDFIAFENGKMIDYQQFVKAVKNTFDATESREINESLVKYKIINRKTAVVTWVGNATYKLKNGVQGKVDPYVVTMLFEKKNGIWKVTYQNEEIIPASSSSN